MTSLGEARHLTIATGNLDKYICLIKRNTFCKFGQIQMPKRGVTSSQGEGGHLTIATMRKVAWGGKHQQHSGQHLAGQHSSHSTKSCHTSSRQTEVRTEPNCTPRTSFSRTGHAEDKIADKSLDTPYKQHSARRTTCSSVLADSQHYFVELTFLGATILMYAYPSVIELAQNQLLKVT